MRSDRPRRPGIKQRRAAKRAAKETAENLARAKQAAEERTLGAVQGPSRADWGDIDENDLDAKWAFDTFLGKSFSAAEAMFESNALNYQEALESMPVVPFNFYAPALIKYVTSERAKGDSSGASSFLRMVFWLLKSNLGIMNPETEHALVSAARQIAQRQEFYDADASIYGNFADRYAEIQQLTKRDT